MIQPETKEQRNARLGDHYWYRIIAFTRNIIYPDIHNEGSHYGYYTLARRIYHKMEKKK